MAPPLLPTTRLTICPVCAEHVKRSEEACPHCGTALAETRATSAAAVVVMGLALAGCPDKGTDSNTTTGSSSETGTTMAATESTGPTEGTGETQVTSGNTAVMTFESDYGSATITGFTTMQTEPTGGETMGETGTTGTTGTTGDTESTTVETMSETGTTGATDPTETTTNAESDYGVAAG